MGNWGHCGGSSTLFGTGVRIVNALKLYYEQLVNRSVTIKIFKEKETCITTFILDQDNY